MPLSRNLGTLTFWNPLGHSRPVTGLIYLYLLPQNIHICSIVFWSVLNLDVELPEDGVTNAGTCSSDIELYFMYETCFCWRHEQFNSFKTHGMCNFKKAGDVQDRMCKAVVVT